MGVKVREKVKGSKVYWLFIDHNGQRKAKRVGTGKAGRKAANSAAEKIAAKLALGDLSVVEPEPVQTSPTSFATLYNEWLQKILPCTRSGTARSSATAHLPRSTSSPSLARKP
jgi:integrase